MAGGASGVSIGVIVKPLGVSKEHQNKVDTMEEMLTCPKEDLTVQDIKAVCAEAAPVP